MNNRMALEEKANRLQEALEEREMDLYYSDSFELSGEIRKDIEVLRKEFGQVQEALNAMQHNGLDKEGDKMSVLHSLEKYKEAERPPTVKAAKPRDVTR